MALIKCIECGKEISDKASSCPNCGCPINIIDKKVMIKIDNVTEMQIYLQTCYVYRKKDDELLATCKQGEILTFEVEEATEIYLKSKNFLRKIELTVSPGDKYVLKQKNMFKPYITKVDIIV